MCLGSVFFVCVVFAYPKRRPFTILFQNEKKDKKIQKEGQLFDKFDSPEFRTLWNGRFSFPKPSKSIYIDSKYAPEN